ncbi:MAG: pilus assembly protein PilM [Alteromonadales bacterium]|nr:pilus assembly protein PilM [Alteromonadales bacterium]
MFSGLKKSSNALIGIDFGSNSIKAVAISKGKGTFQIDAVAEAPLPRGLIVDNRFEDIAKLTQIIKQLRKNFPASYKNVAVAVSGADVITKVIAMNAGLDEIELEAQVELEAENTIPFPIDEVFLDFEVIASNATDKSLNDVLLSAARKETVQAQVDCAEDAGLTTKVVDVASHAQSRACELLFDRTDYDKGIAIVDIGASQMMLNIVHQGNVIFSRAKNHGGSTCTQMMADHYSMKFVEAEKAKVNHEWPVDCDIDVVAPFINMTVNHLRFDLRMFTNAPNNIQVEKVILMGGCQLIPGLVTQLEEELDLDVEVANPFIGFEYKNESDKTLLHKEGTKYMMALGLALRGVQ